MDDKRGRFEAQVLPHLDAAYAFARWLSRSPSAADDIVQDAVLRAFRGFDTLRGSDVKAWLLAIVRNCHLTAVTQQQRRAFVPLPDEQGAEEHRDQEHRARHDLERQQVGLDVNNLGQALSRNEPSAPHQP